MDELLLKANGINKKCIGYGDTLVEICNNFKQERFRDIQLYHEVDLDTREVYDGNRPVNKYLEHANNGEIFLRESVYLWGFGRPGGDSAL